MAMVRPSDRVPADGDGRPATRTCGNCEYFDGGGLGTDGKPKEHHGDCHNTQSPRFETTQIQTCGRFLFDTARWPLRQRQKVKS